MVASSETRTLAGNLSAKNSGEIVDDFLGIEIGRAQPNTC
jgi:hypothetical protein